MMTVAPPIPVVQCCLCGALKRRSELWRDPYGAPWNICTECQEGESKGSEE